MLQKKDYQSLEWATQPGAPLPMEKVEVQVSVASLALGYVHAFVNNLDNKAPQLQDKIQLSEDELEEYLNYLLTCRCDQVAGTLTGFGKLKSLAIPDFMQYILSSIGEYRNRKYAIDVIPVPQKRSTMTFEEAKIISNKLLEFEDVTYISVAAFPPSTVGSEEVMSSAIIASCIRSMKHDLSPLGEYAVAFANLSLSKETAFSALYRTQYDDLGTIQTMCNFKQMV